MDQATKLRAARMAKVYKWCQDRQIGQVYAFFRGCDASLKDHEARIRLVIRTHSPLLVEADEPWLTSMEVSIATLANRKQAA